MINFPLLTSEDIEVKVKQCTKSGVLLLLYKTSRTDAKILDEAVGPMNWTCEYKEIKGNLFCGIGIREKEDQDFVWKWDCGIESDQNDGMEKKAESSDAFKRACSRLGIGRELYSSPKIWASIPTVERGEKYFLANRNASYVITNISYNEETRKIIELEISDADSGDVVYSWTLPTSGAVAKKMVNTLDQKEVKEIFEEKPAPKQEAKEEPKAAPAATVNTQSLKTLVSEIGNMVKSMYEKEKSAASYSKIVAECAPAGFKCNTAEEKDYDIVLAIYTKLIEAGYGN